ncbi:hypothetical protein ASE25_05595 [Terrabacter sp. Root85]|uniref:DUF881 domain-containing protein n=1 Tax=Terrabacter sp. Root85 TaxID=1736603 RepID=UPI0006F2E99C|nr:DUF881 domain-containing protein [Terrabacter sp. Root85]KRC92776.1 hypothetical protein ASE25_05595 [Terrabacter sp. Root85]
MTDAEQPEPPVHAEQPEPATVDDAIDAGDANDVEASPAPSRRRPRLTWGLVVPVVMASAGVMFAMSFQTAQGRDLRADRDLPQLIMEGDSRVAEKASVLDGLEKEVEALSKTNAPTDEHLSSLTRAADELAAPAATTKVRGAALEVTLDDAKRTADSLPDGFTADDIVVHQQDVQAVVNALWTSGAEAMMIQDQRVISTSAVRCVGNTLILQGRVYAPPYRITAIGDIDRMQQGLDADASVNIYKQYVDAVGLGYALHTHNSIEFPAYSGSVDFQYASPIR